MVSSAKILRIGTRASSLALRQTELAVALLKGKFPKAEYRIERISSLGDLDPETEFKELSQKEGKGIFTKALDDALLEKKIDVAVHSLKDLPVEIPKGLELGAVLKREDPRDAWISKDGQKFDSLQNGAKIGTSSVRRGAQLKYQKPEVEVIPLRGNVDTRIRKLKGGNGAESMDGIVIALAGVRRAGLEKEVTEILSIEQMLPAVGQGAIALLVRQKDTATRKKIAAVTDETTRIEVEVERAFLKELGGGCHVPIAGTAKLEEGGGIITLHGGVFSPDGRHSLRATLSAPRSEGIAMAKRLAGILLRQGADKLLAEKK